MSFLTFSNKTVWVIGGAGFFGSAITRKLDQLGAKVLCIDLPGKAAAMIASSKLKHALPLECNFRDVAELEPFLDETTRQHGTPWGIVSLPTASSVGKYFETLSIAEMESTLTGNISPLLLLCQKMGTRMKENGGGSIVLYSSMYGVVSPDPSCYLEPLTPNPVDYGAAKAAVLQMMRYMAVHFAPHSVRFNAISPGPFPHDAFKEKYPDSTARLRERVPMKRFGNAEEIVAPTLLLLSPEASYVTGQNLMVDGGWTAW